MNPMILCFVALLAVSANAGIAHIPEQHEGYQTPFLPIAGPQLPSAGGYGAAEPLPVAQAYQSVPVQAIQYEPAAAAHHEADSHHVVSAQYQTAPHYEVAQNVQPIAAPVAPLAQPISVTQHVQHVVPPQPTVQLQKTIIKHIQVPYPVNKYVKVDRHVPYYVDRHYKVDRPYEVVKYIQKPYIVKVERKVPVPIISKVPVPKPIVQVEAVAAEPQHVSAHDFHAQQQQQQHHPW